MLAGQITKLAAASLDDAIQAMRIRNARAIAKDETDAKKTAQQLEEDAKNKGIVDDGKPAVLFNIYEQPDGNAVQIAREVQAKLAGVKLPAGVKLGNPRPADGGLDAESAAEGEKRIPLVLRHRDRAVSADDFDAIETLYGAGYRFSEE